MSDVSGPPPDGAHAPGWRRSAAATAIALAVGAALAVFLATRARAPPLLPGDLVHRAALGGQVPRDCLTCHAKSGPVPQRRTHTGRQDCENCHALP